MLRSVRSVGAAEASANSPRPSASSNDAGAFSSTTYEQIKAFTQQQGADAKTGDISYEGSSSDSLVKTKDGSLIRVKKEMQTADMIADGGDERGVDRPLVLI